MSAPHCGNCGKRLNETQRSRDYCSECEPLVLKVRKLELRLARAQQALTAAWSGGTQSVSTAKQTSRQKGD
jgi:hypothetical protein